MLRLQLSFFCCCFPGHPTPPVRFWTGKLAGCPRCPLPAPPQAPPLSKVPPRCQSRDTFFSEGSCQRWRHWLMSTAIISFIFFLSFFSIQTGSLAFPVDCRPQKIGCGWNSTVDRWLGATWRLWLVRESCLTGPSLPEFALEKKIWSRQLAAKDESSSSFYIFITMISDAAIQARRPLKMQLSIFRRGQWWSSRAAKVPPRRVGGTRPPWSAIGASQHPAMAATWSSHVCVDPTCWLLGALPSQ